MCWFFSVLDHGIDEVVGWHTAKIGDRWAALEPMRKGSPSRLQGVRQGHRRRAEIRCDGRPQDLAEVWINEVK